MLRLRAWPLLLVLPCCATLGTDAPRDEALPTSGVGPFRRLEPGEVLGVAPFVLEDRDARYREPSVLPLSGAGTGLQVALYAVARQGTGADARDVIVRTRADDGRSFFGTATDFGHRPAVVLLPDAAWEGGRVGGPSVLRAPDGSILLYYDAQGGIGLARSEDGFTFVKEPGPVLVADPSVAWETTPPRAPSVCALPDGRLRMLYASGGAIGEAESADGVTWIRLDADPSTPELDPVLGPAPPQDPPSFDALGVDDPVVAPRITPAGRLHVRVLYTGYGPGEGGRTSAIGFAARYGDRGPLVRQATPVYSAGRNEAAPALLEWASGSLLYVHEDRAYGGGLVTPGIAAARAPANGVLPPPGAYASGP